MKKLMLSIFVCLVASLTITSPSSAGNYEDCLQYCDNNDQCVRCYRYIGCGRGQTRMATFRAHSGHNYYACRLRENFPVHTSTNQEECSAWCHTNAECDRCDNSVGCGIGYRRIATFRDHPGPNWYGCAER